MSAATGTVHRMNQNKNAGLYIGKRKMKDRLANRSIEIDSFLRAFTP
jgi:hypothetical protein